MLPRISSLAPLLALSALLMGVSLGCGGSGGTNPPPVPASQPDAERSSVEVSRARDVVADGEDASAVTVTVRGSDGAALSGLRVQLAVSGEGASVTPAQGITDAGGVVRAALKATAPGVKTLTVSARGTQGEVVLASKPGITFVRRPPSAARLAFTSASLSAVAGSPVGPVLEVAVQDEAGQTLPDASHLVTLSLGAHPEGAVLEGTLTARAVNGVARFTEAVLRKAGAGYTLVASAQGLTAATSAAFDVAAGPAVRLAFAQQPVRQSERRTLAPVRVRLEDTFGNTVAATSPVVSVALQGGPGRLVGVTAVAPVAGVASFEELGVDLAGTGYTLTASAEGLEGVTSARFDIVDDVAPAVPVLRVTHVGVRLVDVEWTAVGDDGMQGMAASYDLRYSTSNIVTEVDFALATPVIQGQPQAAGGLETANLLHLTPETPYYLALKVTDDAGNAVRSATLAVTTRRSEGVELSLAIPPLDLTADSTVPDLRLMVLDMDGRLATSYSAPVTLTLNQDPTFTRTANAVGGEVTFSGLRITRPGTGYRFVFTSGALPAAESQEFTVRPGAVRSLELTGPASLVAGAQGSTEVIAYDAHGNVATGYRGTVHFTATDNAAVLPPDTAFTAADAGRKTFNVALRTAGRQSVTVADGTMTDSLAVDVSAAAPAKLAFTAQPRDTRVRAALDAVRVTLLDAFDNVTGASSPAVTLALNGNAAATLGGTRSRVPANGVASFADLSVDAEGSLYTLTASAQGLTEATSAAFVIVDDVAPARPVLAASAVGARSLTVAWDAVGDDGTQGTAAAYDLRYATTAIVTEADFTAATRVATGAPRAPGTRESATLTSLTPGTPYFVALRVTDGAGNSERSANLAVTTETQPVTQLAFSQQPVGGIAGEALASIRVALRDADGQVVTSATSAVTLTLLQDASITRTVNAVDGVATFSGLRINTAGTTYSFQATSGLLPPATSTTFAIRPGAARRFEVASMTDPVTAGQAAPFEVTAFDAHGNVATGYTGTARFTSSDGAAQLPAGLAFTAADQGVATTSVTLRTSGFQTLTAADAVDATVTGTVSVNVRSGSAARLAFVGQPVDGRVRSALAEVRVAVLDAFGNTTPVGNPEVTLTLNGNPAATLGGTAVRPASHGAVAFPGLTVDADGTGYTLTASAPGLTGATSTAFSILDDVAPSQPLLAAGAITRGSITVEWNAVGDDGVLGTAAAYELRYATTAIVTDADFARATLAPTGAPRAPGTREAVTLSGLVPSTPYHVALRVTDNAGNAVRSAALTASTQDTEATQLVFTRQPADGIAGVALADVQVTLQDENGHTAIASSAAVTLTLSSDPTVTVTVSASAGVATFSGLRVDTAGPGYTFQASSGVLPFVSSAPFAIRPGAAGRLVLAGPAAPVTAGQAGTFSVTAYDAFDNVATGYTGTLHVTATDAAATVPGDITFTAANAGRADFSVTLRTAGEQRVSVADAALSAQAAVTVTPGPAAGLALTAPDTTTAGAGARLSLTALDAFGNVATGYTGTVRFSSTDGAASLPPDFTFLPANGGREQFDIILRTAGAREVRVEDVADAAVAAIRTVQVTPHFVDSLSLRAEAGPHEAGAAFTLEVVALDAYGNVATGYDSRVSFSSPDVHAVLPGEYVFTPGDAGRHSFPGAVLGTAGRQSITVTDFAGRTSTLELEVEPAAAAGLELVSQVGTLTAGDSFELEVIARDTYGNVALDYLGTVRFTSTDSRATLPADTTFTAADAGRRRFQVSLVTAGFMDVTATDTVNASVTGFLTGSVVAGPPDRLAFTAWPFSGMVRMPLMPVMVEVQDAYGNRSLHPAPDIQVSLFGGDPSTTLSGTMVVSPVEGLAHFNDLSVDQESPFMMLTATATGLASALSPSFTVWDFIPPELPVLSASDVAATRVTLVWTAVGDDGMSGTAPMYTVRYSPQPILTDGDWANAVPGPELAPQPPGSAMSAAITGLSPSTRYYFGLEVRDGGGNRVLALFDTTTAAPSAPCDTVVCTPPEPSCSPDGRSVVTYTSQCREENGEGVCDATPASTTRCRGGQACGNGFCAPITQEQQAGRVVITELRVLGGDERIELHNPTGSDIDLRGFTFEDWAGEVLPLRALNDLDGTAGASLILPAGGFLVGVGNPADGVVPAGAGFVYGPPGTSFTLMDTGDLLVLSAADGVIEDFVDFRQLVTDPNQPLTASSFVGFAGASTQLEGTRLDADTNDDPRNWCVTFYPAAGTKQKVSDTLGAANGTCNAAVINEVLIDPANTDDGTTFIEIAGPGGAVIGGAQLTDIEGNGTATVAGRLNTDGTRDTGETDGIFIIPNGTRIPADGILLIADVESVNRTTQVPNFVSGVDVHAYDVDFENGARDAIQLIARDGILLDTVGTDSQGDPLSTNVAYNTLALYETGTALYPPIHASLARSTLSLDSDDNRADFHGDPTPTPGLPNDTVNVTVTRVSPSNGLASTTTAGFVVTGTDIPLDSGLRFGTNTTVVSCSVNLDGTGMTCTVPSNGFVPAVVDVTVLLSRSVSPTNIVLPRAFTYTGVRNETNTASEADYCNLQWPPTLTVASGQWTPFIYAQIYEAGLTEPAGAGPGIIAELGFGPLSSNPTTDSSWRFFPGSFNVEVGNNDEFMGSFIAPVVTAPRQYSYTSRFSFDNGLNWTYCDLNGAGAVVPELTFESNQLGVLTVNP